jgi:hypothetical protein
VGYMRSDYGPRHDPGQEDDERADAKERAPV